MDRAEINKLYYELNKDKISSQQKEYRKFNRDYILYELKNYYQQNKENLLEQYKNYYLDNRDKILQYNKQPYTCICGATVCLNYKSRHLKTQKHLAYANHTCLPSLNI